MIPRAREAAAFFSTGRAPSAGQRVVVLIPPAQVGAARGTGALGCFLSSGRPHAHSSSSSALRTPVSRADSPGAARPRAGAEPSGRPGVGATSLKLGHCRAARLGRARAPQGYTPPPLPADPSVMPPVPATPPAPLRPRRSGPSLLRATGASTSGTTSGAIRDMAPSPSAPTARASSARPTSTRSRPTPTRRPSARTSRARPRHAGLGRRPEAERFVYAQSASPRRAALWLLCC